MSRVLLNANDEITKKYNPFFHRGVDIVKYKSKVTDVVAHSEGIVVNVKNNNKYGNYVKLKHNNGMYTLYAHLDRINVHKSENVKRGTLIGTMGKSGDAKGIHLHFEVRNRKNKRINPTKYLVSDLPNNKEKNNISYQVYDNKKKKWLKSVNEVYDYAGNIGNPIGAIYVNLNVGKIEYQVHEVGKSWFSKSNLDDYAGNIGKNIDGIQISSDDVKIVYRVHLIDGNWMPWVNNYDDIYDGVIDGIQLRILEDV